MKIAFYAPFKPLDHPNPSGDRIIGNSVRDFLLKNNHLVRTVSRLRSRWIFNDPERMAAIDSEINQITKNLRTDPVDLWLTYHCYYKAPDLLGPVVCEALSLPYVIFQGSYATKYERRKKTKPGFTLNRKSLLYADHLFVNRKDDLVNLLRLVPKERCSYIRPGIEPDEFQAAAEEGKKLRDSWGVGDEPVIVTAAMFRDDVKTAGLVFVIRSCSRLLNKGLRFQLIIAGDGIKRPLLMELAQELLPGIVHFTGQLQRSQMANLYSAGDIFAFPGINESLGMVFLEAQSCGLPVVAFDNGGIPEVVQNNRTGILTPPGNEGAFDQALANLLEDRKKRRTMGKNAASYVRQHHDISTNYRLLGKMLEKYRPS